MDSLGRIGKKSLARYLLVIVGCVIFAVIGVMLLIATRAAGPFASAEPENGTITTPAASITDTAASGGSAVQFKAATTVGRVVNVSTSAQLTAALSAARPGDIITMAAGTYSGKYAATTSGTAAAPITLKGSRSAIINGGSTGSGYTLALGAINSTAKVSYWRYEGFTVTGGQKGIMWDNVQRSVIDSVAVQAVGHEGIHLRNHSSDNIIQNTLVTRTGLDVQGFGEGIYIGSAVSNWSNNSQGVPDASDRNQVIGNSLINTGSESMDIKEGTHDGIIRGNTFDGTGMCPTRTMTCHFGDSLLDIKGEGYQVSSNILKNMRTVWLEGNQENDAIQIHVIANTGSEGSGTNNIFTSNTISNVGGLGFYFQTGATGSTINCNNIVTSADGGYSNVPCR